MSEASLPEAVPAELARRAERLFRQPWQFLAGYVALEQLPAMSVPEVALAGRSNVGKSSLINALTGTRGLARTSNTPGRTQELNYFAPADLSCRLVDMPGYGYAEAPKKAVEAWNDLLRRFLRGRTSLRRVLVLIDARRGVKAVDEEMMALMDAAAVSYQAVLTKADKLKPGELTRVAEATSARLARRPACFPGLLITSAQAGTGIAELRLAVTAAL